MQEKSKHLITFFDIDKTILFFYPNDPTGTNITLCDTIAQAQKGDWTGSGNVESFKEFIYREFIPPNDYSPATRTLQRDMMANLVSYAEEHYPEIHMRATFEHLKQTLTPYDGLAPSFIQALSALKNSHIPYSIVLYTMGKSDAIVLNALPKHSDIQFTKQGVFKEHTLFVDNHIFTTPQEIIESIQPGEHQVWQSDYDFWSRLRSPETKETSAFGKLVPFYVSPNAETIVMAFDDNVHDQISAQRCIIHPVIMDGSQDVDVEKLGLLVSVPPLDAALDPHFFIDKINHGLQAMHVAELLEYPDTNCADMDHNDISYFTIGTRIPDSIAEAA